MVWLYKVKNQTGLDRVLRGATAPSPTPISSRTGTGTGTSASRKPQNPPFFWTLAGRKRDLSRSVGLDRARPAGLACRHARHGAECQVPSLDVTRWTHWHCALSSGSSVRATRFCVIRTKPYLLWCATKVVRYVPDSSVRCMPILHNATRLVLVLQ